MIDFDMMRIIFPGKIVKTDSKIFIATEFF